MADTTCEVVLIRDLLNEVLLLPSSPMRLYRDYKAVIHIADNLVFHERTKHIKVDCHLVCQKVMEDKTIKTQYILSTNLLTNLLSKKHKFNLFMIT